MENTDLYFKKMWGVIKKMYGAVHKAAINAYDNEKHVELFTNQYKELINDYDIIIIDSIERNEYMIEVIEDIQTFSMLCMKQLVDAVYEFPIKKGKRDAVNFVAYYAISSMDDITTAMDLLKYTL
jgi:hypothetical protein